MKKLLFLLLASVVIVSLLAVPVFAGGLDLVESQIGTKFYTTKAISSSSAQTNFPSGLTWSGSIVAGGQTYHFTNKVITIDGSTLRVEGTFNTGVYGATKWDVYTDEIVSFTVSYNDGSGSVSSSPLIKDSAIQDGFRTALSATGDTLNLIASENLLPYLGLIIGISVLSAVLVYIKWLL